MQIKGHVHYNPVTGVFDMIAWVEDSGSIVTASLGTLAYQMYDRNGIMLTGAASSATGIAPLANGLYNIVEAVNPPWLTNREAFLAYVTLTVGVTTYSTYLPFSVLTI